MYECAKFSVLRGLGFSTMIMGFVLKTPQISKIYSSGSVEGISILAYYMESGNYINSCAVGIHLGLPFGVWGDPLIPVFFNSIIILMMWHFDAKSYSTMHKLTYLIVMISYATFMFSEDLKPAFLPTYFWDLITASSIFLNISARVPQILKSYQNKSTGQLALCTFSMNLLRTSIRTTVVLLTSDDLLYRLQFVLSWFFNMTLVF